MKKRFLVSLCIISLLLISGVSLASEVKPMVVVPGITITPQYLRIEVGASVDVTTDIDISLVSEDAVFWNSFKKSVATVASSNGYNNIIQGVSQGRAIIQVIASIIGAAIDGTCNVIVVTKDYPEPNLPTGTPTSIKATWATQERDVDALLFRTNATRNMFTSADFVSSGNGIKLKEDIIKQAHTKVDKNVILKMVNFFPISAGLNEPKQTLAFELGFDTDVIILENLQFDKIKLFSMQDTKTGNLMTYTNDPTKFADGMFTVLDEFDNIAEGEVEISTHYKILAFVKDGGAWDIDKKENSEIVNILSVTNLLGTVVIPIPDPVKTSSGCNTSPYAPFALLLSAPLFIICKKK